MNAWPGIRPDELLHFVELDEFGADWLELGLDVENDLWSLQTSIMSGPQKAPIIPGTGGLRKMRFAPEAWNTGKSGGIRVCYAYFPRHWLVLLVMAYAKGRQETMSAAQKQGAKRLLGRFEKWLDEQRSS